MRQQGLRDDLQRAGLVVWLDREVIPSQNRDNEIRKAIESSRYVIALISSKSIEKIGSIQLDNQSEFQKADLLARLDDREIPAELKNIKYVDLFPDWEEGIRSIVRAMGVPSTEQTPQTIRSVYEKLEKYRDKLLHIDGRNHSILLRRISDKWCFDLTKISSEKKIVDHALLDRRPIRIQSKSNKSEARKDNAGLRYLYRNIVQIEREKGLQETYLGFPFLVGNVNPEFFVRGPFILFPINLEFRQESKQPGWYIVFPEDGKPILNRALIGALKKNGGPSLTDSFADELEDLFNNIEDSKKKASNGVEATFVNGLIKLLKEKEFPLDYANSNLDNVSIFKPLAVSNGKVSINDILIENQRLHLENLINLILVIRT